MQKRFWLILVILLFTLLLAACGRGSALPPTNLAPTPRVVGTATAEALAAMATEGGAAGFVFVEGDAAAGDELFHTTFSEANGFACVTCHNPNSEDRLVGPGLAHIGARAANRVPGMNAPTYIYTSITKPDEYVVPDFLDTLMPEVYSELFSEDDLNNLIAYLLSL